MRQQWLEPNKNETVTCKRNTGVAEAFFFFFWGTGVPEANPHSKKEKIGPPILGFFWRTCLIFIYFFKNKHLNRWDSKNPRSHIFKNPKIQENQ